MSKPTITERMLEGYTHLTDWTFFPVMDIVQLKDEAEALIRNYTLRGFDSILVEFKDKQHFEVWGKKGTKQGLRGEGI